MTPFDESAAVEAMARAIFEQAAIDSHIIVSPWQGQDRAEFRRQAKAALSALRPFLGDVRAQTIEECAAVADEWYRQFCTADPKFISAGTFARDAVADIADEIRGLKLAQSSAPPDSGKEG